MNIKRRTFILCLLLIALALCLFSCNNEGQTNESIEIDMREMATEIMGKAPFAEELVERKLNDYAQYGFIYGFEQSLESVVSYIGGGATPQELLIVKLPNADDAKLVKTALEAYRDKQITIYQPYAANEVPNLENAVIKQSGTYVVYCVAKDDVSSTINEYFK